MCIPLALISLIVVATAASNREETNAPPSDDEIRTIESRVKLPDGAYPLDAYVRYYYRDTRDDGTAIEGGYVTKSELDHEGIPTGNAVVLVGGSEDIPAPWDAGCEVVWVSYLSSREPQIRAECSSTLSFPSSGSGSGPGDLVFVVAAAIVGLILAPVAWFSRRWLARRKQHSSKRDG